MTDSAQPFLRAWTLDDAEALRDARAAADDLQTQFGDADLSTIEAARAVIAGSLQSGGSHRNWAVVFDGRAVGNVGVSAIEHRHGTAWAYYWLAPAARGLGFATRALIAATEWAFAHDVFRVELGHRVNNPSSCRVATRAGFQAEGVERQKLRYGDERFDVETHARLATDPAPDVDALTRMKPPVC